MNRLQDYARLLASGSLAIAALSTVAGAQLHLKASAEKCSAAPASSAGAVEWLTRAKAVTLPAVAGQVLQFRSYYDIALWEQSDRMYEPYVPNVADRNTWYDGQSGLIARQPVERALAPNGYAAELIGPTDTYFIRDTIAMKLTQGDGRAGPLHTLNPWDVLRRWDARAGEVKVAALCNYREQPRIVLSLDTERLYLTASDATPIKLEREEAHYLFGQVKAEYVWTTWWGVRGGGRYPVASFLQYDGETYHRLSIGLGSARLVARDSAPKFALPATITSPPAAMTTMSADPDTVRVSPNTWMLVTRAYTQAVTLQRDTVFIFDATSSEARARADSAWIAKLFPGKHPVVLVVTDLAWPHISGLRFWVARGATIVSHKGSEAFLRMVVDRKWTRQPDVLEASRSSARFKFIGVTDSLRLGGGAVTVHAMRGQSTEGAVGAWVPGDQFFWAGDYIQGDVTSPYARDVAATIRALGIAPVKIGAQHVTLSDGAEFLRRFGTIP